MAKRLGTGLKGVVEQPASRRVNILLPADLRTLLDRSVIDEGYGLKGRSRWIREAVMKLPTYPDFIDLISESAPRDGSQVQVLFSGEPLTALLDIVRDVRQREPMREGVFSDVVRASIYQRLLRTRTEDTRKTGL